VTHWCAATSHLAAILWATTTTATFTKEHIMDDEEFCAEEANLVSAIRNAKDEQEAHELRIQLAELWFADWIEPQAESDSFQ